MVIHTFMYAGVERKIDRILEIFSAMHCNMPRHHCSRHTALHCRILSKFCANEIITSPPNKKWQTTPHWTIYQISILIIAEITKRPPIQTKSPKAIDERLLIDSTSPVSRTATKPSVGAPFAEKTTSKDIVLIEWVAFFQHNHDQNSTRKSQSRTKPTANADPPYIGTRTVSHRDKLRHKAIPKSALKEFS